MLAQNFKTPADLGIPEDEYAALIKVLGMLERCELKHADSQDIHGDFLFHMGTQGVGCGTPACIGGWVAHLLDLNQIKYVDSYMDKGALRDLYWENMSSLTTPEQAGIAVRSFLTTGKPNWRLALAAS